MSDFVFHVHEPEPPLHRWVESIWYAKGTVPYKREKIAPTGSTVFLFILGDPIIETADNGEGETIRSDFGILVGPHDRPVINEPTGETHAVGVVLTPVGVRPTLGMVPSNLRGRVLHLNEAWPEAAGIRQLLLGEGDPSAMVSTLERQLTSTVGAAESGVSRIESALQLIEADPVLPIADVAASVDVSHSHLVREFTYFVGITPRAMARLLRLRRLLEGLDVRDATDWADLSVSLGWYDQAHLIRDFKRHTGVTPTEYVTAQRATFGQVAPEDAAGFVPQS